MKVVIALTTLFLVHTAWANDWQIKCEFDDKARLITSDFYLDSKNLSKPGLQEIQIESNHGEMATVFGAMGGPFATILRLPSASTCTWEPGLAADNTVYVVHCTNNGPWILSSLHKNEFVGSVTPGKVGHLRFYARSMDLQTVDRYQVCVNTSLTDSKGVKTLLDGCMYFAPSDCSVVK
jgi:hypothetical protein